MIQKKIIIVDKLAFLKWQECFSPEEIYLLLQDMDYLPLSLIRNPEIIDKQDIKDNELINPQKYEIIFDDQIEQLDENHKSAFYSSIVEDLSNKILIANWFDKLTLEELLDEELSDEEYKQIVKRFHDYYDEISEMVFKIVTQILNEIRRRDKNDYY